MNATVIFVCEVLFSLAVSVTILVRLQALLRRIGSEVCERGAGATEFWVAYTQLMVMIAPLLLVSWLSHAGTYEPSVVKQMQSSLSVVLFGQFVGLVLV